MPVHRHIVAYCEILAVCKEHITWQCGSYENLQRLRYMQTLARDDARTGHAYTRDFNTAVLIGSILIERAQI